MLRWLSNEFEHFLSKGDPRVAHLPLMKSPIPVAVICITYALFVTKIGPHLMRNRKPFQVRNLMIFYNFAMIVCSSIVVYNELFYHWLRPESSLKCDPVDYSVNPISMRIVYNSYFYFLLKFVEFADTLFFVARKKNEHISTLHVIHHGLLPFSVWWGAKFVPGGHATFFGFINSIVHVIMYTYYGLAALGPHMQKYLWWKKYLTMIQLVQFVMIGVHSFQLFFRTCDFPKIFGLWIGSHGVLFWFLFSNFYRKTYIEPKKNGPEETRQTNCNASSNNNNNNNNLNDTNGNNNLKKVY